MTLEERIQAAAMSANAMRKVRGCVSCTHTDDYCGDIVTALATADEITVWHNGVVQKLDMTNV